MSHHFIKYTDLHFRYDDGKEALKGINLTVRHGERVALFGLNGSGKSTLLLLTDGFIYPSSGEVNVGDIPLSKKTVKTIRRSVGFLFQNPDDMLFMPSIYDDVAFGPRNMDLPEPEVDRRVSAALDAVGLKGMERKASFQLSGGERRRAAIASVLSMEPDILLLDEPTANLDALARRNLITLLDAFSHTIIVATHDMEMAKQLCNRVVLLKEGTVAADSSCQDFFRDEKNLNEFGLL